MASKISKILKGNNAGATSKGSGKAAPARGSNASIAQAVANQRDQTRKGLRSGGYHS